MESFSVNLTHQDLISVAGKDSEVFLQGQLTCDLHALTSPSSCPGCLCDLKGRVLASFTVWKLDDIFYLEMAAGLAGIVIESLKKYMVFYKAEMATVTGSITRLGLAGQAAAALLGDLFPLLPEEPNSVVETGTGYWLRLIDADQQRYELWSTENADKSLIEKIRQALPEGQDNDWRLLEQNLGFHQLEADESGLYTPQELNYDLLGHISFTKGCYTGQEIVARMHYRGKAKKRLYRLHIRTRLILQKHMKIIDAEAEAESAVNVAEIISISRLDPEVSQVLAIMSDPGGRKLALENDREALIELIL